MAEGRLHSRRDLLAVAAAAASGLAVSGLRAPPARAAPHIASPIAKRRAKKRLARAASRRTLAFHHLHTGESIDLVYWADGHYLPDATQRINYLLRDFRTGDIHPIDPKLLDLLAQMRGVLRSSDPYLVISGYRSPQTNEMLRATTEGVASNSQHLYGRAIDIRIADRPLSAVHRVAWGLQLGGVGYYPRSDFVHVDVGPVRRWS